MILDTNRLAPGGPSLLSAAVFPIYWPIILLDLLENPLPIIRTATHRTHSIAHRTHSIAR